MAHQVKSEELKDFIAKTDLASAAGPAGTKRLAIYIAASDLSSACYVVFSNGGIVYEGADFAKAIEVYNFH